MNKGIESTCERYSFDWNIDGSSSIFALTDQHTGEVQLFGFGDPIPVATMTFQQPDSN